jgi:hypothetical protein
MSPSKIHQSGQVNGSQQILSFNESSNFESDNSSSFIKKRRTDNSLTEGVVSHSKVKPHQMKSPKEVLESITMIRDLINTNTKLRDKIEIMKDQNDKM